MDEARRSNRPTPRTPAAIEAELRRRIRSELGEAREAADGELDDAALAAVIARAIAIVLGWHLEAPEHTRNATLSSRSWRGAAGPRGGPDPSRDFQRRDAGPPRAFGPPPRDFPRRGPGGRGARPFGPSRDFEDPDEAGPRPRGPRRWQDRGGPDAPDDAGLRGFDDNRPPRGPKPRRQPGPRRGGGRPPSRGGFGPRRPR